MAALAMKQKRAGEAASRHVGVGCGFRRRDAAGDCLPRLC
jgi:hypothetical protein